MDLVQEIKDNGQVSYENGQFPVILVPTQEKTLSFWISWVSENSESIKSKLLKHGVIMFRGFPIKCPEDYDSFVEAFGYKDFPYVGGAAPRTVITKRVFTANEAPSDQKIPYHHEMAQVPNFPKVLFFHCSVAPSSGGETSIVPSPLVYEEMSTRSPDFVKKLQAEGVRYVRVLPENDDPTSPIGRGWKSTYLTESKEEVEKKAAEQGTQLEWRDDGCVKTTTKVLAATRLDPRTGKTSWFNSIIAAYLGWQDSRNDRHRAVQFGNGDYMDNKDMTLLEEILEKHTADITWKEGDVMMVDNRQALHARRPFAPPRRILACLCDE